MISVDEARNLIFSQKPNWGIEKISLITSVGRTLAEDIRADRDFPPFDRVTMDGIALSFDAYERGQRRFEVTGIQLAGEPISVLRDAGCTIEIMTGAILSENCDMVVRYEDLSFSEVDGKKWVEIADDNAFRWKNVHKKGSDETNDTLLIAKGRTITSNMVSIIATVGCAEVQVRRLPRVAVIATGDELVDVSEKPAPHQIRKSNTTTIEAELTKRNIEFESFHLLDDKEGLRKALERILDDFDVLLLSGGVSKGKADYLPEVLEEIGVKKLFHRVAQRPGKPFWFGVSQREKPVFAFPGNPISTLMCFRIYFLEWLDQVMGNASPVKKARLMEPFHFKPQLGCFLQVRTESLENGELTVYPEIGNGSGDLSNLSKSDAFLYLPPGETDFETGQQFLYYPFN